MMKLCLTADWGEERNEVEFKTEKLCPHWSANWPIGWPSGLGTGERELRGGFGVSWTLGYTWRTMEDEMEDGVDISGVMAL